ncbi:MAG: oxidative damage protection protein [Pseudomonadales bacterium]|mgnify:CR=1 FL=1|nr:oxidative damage protection protein [Pseudomonadales bacterium]
MTRTVTCRKYGQAMEGLEAPPLPGKRGQDIFDQVSKQAWQEWQTLQTMLINEKHLRLIDPEARRYLNEQMEKFLSNQPTDVAEHFRPQGEEP